MKDKFDKLIEEYLQCKKIPGTNRYYKSWKSDTSKKELEKKKLETLGVLISQYCEYDGEKIMTVILSALEDSNFHSFREKVKEEWDYYSS